MNGIYLVVFLSALTLVSGVSLVTKPQSIVVRAGEDARFNCTPDGDLYGETLTWREHVSQKAGQTIYRTDMDGPNDPEDYEIVNTYDLKVRKTDIMDGGWYSCQLSSDQSPSMARMVVVDAPVIVQNMVDFVEGNV